MNDDKEFWWVFIADFVEIDEEGNTKFFKGGKEIAYPWEIVE